MPMMGVAKRVAKSRFEAMLSQKGFVGNGSTDDAPALNNAISAAVSANLHIGILPDGVDRVRCDSSLSIDIAKFGLDLNGAQLNYRFMTSGNAINFTASGSSNDYQRYIPTVSNGSILRRDGSDATMRDDSVTNNISALVFDNASGEPGDARARCYNLAVEGFKDAIYVGRNAYLLRFFNCDFLRNMTTVAARDKTAGVFANSGEMVAFVGCLGWGCRIIDIEGIFVHWYGGSLDYPSAGAPAADAGGHYQYIANVQQGAHLHLVSPHVEFRDTQQAADDALFHFGQDALIDWQGGELILAEQAYDGTSTLSNAADGYKAFNNLKWLAKNNANARGVRINPAARQKSALLKSRALVGFADSVTVSPPVFEVSGTDGVVGTGGVAGKSIIPLACDQAQLNAAGSAVLGVAVRGGLLRRPNFDALEDFWFICGAGGGTLTGQTSDTAATNITLSVSGNTLRLARSTGAGGGAGNLRLRLALPIERNKVVGTKFTVAKTGGAAGNVITCALHHAQQKGMTALYMPRFVSVGQIGSTTTLLTFAGNGSESAGTFDIHSFGSTFDTGDRVARNERGTHFMIEFDVGTVDATTTAFELQITRASVTQG